MKEISPKEVDADQRPELHLRHIKQEGLISVCDGGSHEQQH